MIIAELITSHLFQLSRTSARCSAVADPSVKPTIVFGSFLSVKKLITIMDTITRMVMTMATSIFMPTDTITTMTTTCALLTCT